MSRFTHFIRKVFAVKILLSGKCLLFLTLDEDDEKCEYGHLVEGHRAKLLLLLLQHSSDRIFVAKSQGISSEKMQCEM